MNSELLRTELERAEEAELQSDEQLRNLVALIETARQPGSLVTGTECAKTISAALALNERLRERADKLRQKAAMAANQARRP